jgi:hypothetical protein
VTSCVQALLTLTWNDPVTSQITSPPDATQPPAQSPHPLSHHHNTTTTTLTHTALFPAHSTLYKHTPQVPSGLLPVLEIDGRVVTESQVTMFLLEDTHMLQPAHHPTPTNTSSSLV